MTRPAVTRTALAAHDSHAPAVGAKDGFNLLPDELLEKIFEFRLPVEHTDLSAFDERFRCGTADLTALRCTSRSMNALFNRLNREGRFSYLGLSMSYRTISGLIEGARRCDPQLTDALQRCIDATVSLAIDLDAADTAVKHAVHHILSRSRHLRHLELRGSTDLSEIQALVRTLTDSPGLHTLKLLNNTNVSARAVAEGLKNSRSLQSLVIKGGQTSDEEMKVIWNALCVNQSLETLVIECSYLLEQAVQCMAKALDQHRKLVRLALLGTSIGDNGFDVLTRHLQKDSSLRSLSLDAHSISVDAFNRFFDALAANTTLKELSFSMRRFDDSLLEQVACMLQNNGGLTKLTLDTGRISYEAAAVLASSLGENRSLQTLHLKARSIEQTGLAALRDVAGSRAFKLDLLR